MEENEISVCVGALHFFLGVFRLNKSRMREDVMCFVSEKKSL